MENLFLRTKLLLGFILFVFTSSFAQVNGDYRSITGTGLAWNVNTNWQKFNGTSWVTPIVGDYPGNVAFLAVNNTVSIVSSSSVNANFTIPVANTIPTLTIDNGGTLTSTANITFRATTFNVNGIYTGAATTPTYNIGTLNVNSGGNFNGGTSTATYALATALNINASSTFNFGNATYSGTAAANFASSSITDGNAAGTITLASLTSSVSVNIISPLVITGATNITAGTFSTTNTVSYGGNIVNATALTHTGAVTFTGNSILSSTGAGTLTFGSNVTINTGFTVTNEKTISIAGNLNGQTGTATFINSTTSSVLNYQGANAPMATGTLTATVSGNIVNYNATTGNQTIKATTYDVLNINGALTLSRTKTLGAGTTIVTGTLTVDGVSSTIKNTLQLAGNSITVSGITTVNTFGIIDDNATAGTNSFAATTNNGTWTNSNGPSYTFTSTLTNNGTFSGNANISVAAALQNNLGASLALGTGTNLFSTTFDNNGTYTQGAGTYTYTGAFTNSGTFTGTATAVSINFSSTFNNTGTYTANAGAYTYGNTVSSSNAATFGGTTSTFNNTVTISAGTATFSSATSTFNGAINLTGGTSTFSGATNMFFNGNIAVATGAVFNATTTSKIASNLNVTGDGSIAFTAVTILNNIVFDNQTTITISGALNGGNTNSEFVNSLGTSVLNYTSTTEPMLTGKLTAVVTGNVVNYNATTVNQTIKGTTYDILNINGVLTGSRTKFLGSGTTTVTGTLTVDGVSNLIKNTLQLQGNSITVTGTTVVNTNGIIDDNAAAGANSFAATTNNGRWTNSNAPSYTFTSSFTNNGTFNGSPNIAVTGAFVNALGATAVLGTGTNTFSGTFSNDGTYTANAGTYTYGNTVSSSNTATFGGTSSTFNNTVTISASTAAFSSATSTFNGAINLTGGTSTFNGATNMFFNGNIDVATGASFNATTTSRISTSLNVTGAGSISFAGVTIANNVVFDNQTTITISGSLIGSNSNSEFKNGLSTSVLTYIYGFGSSAVYPMSIGKFTVNTVGNTVNYSAVGSNQYLNATTYHHLNIGGLNTNISKYLIGATVVNGNLTVSGTNSTNQNFFRLNGFNLTVNGSTTINAFGQLDGVFVGNYSFVGPFEIKASGTATLQGTTTSFSNTFINAGTYSSTSGTYTYQSTVNNTGSFSAGIGTSTYAGLFTSTSPGTYTATTGTYNFENGITSTGTFTPGGGTYVLRTNSQTISFATAPSFANLTIGKIADVALNTYTISNNVTVSSTLSFVKGIINTGSNTITAAGLVGFGSSTGWVNGNLSRTYTTGAPGNRTFAVGTATVYAAVDITPSAVTTAGTITVRTDDNDAAAFGTSCLDASKSVNRNWTITKGTIVTTAGCLYSITPTFANPSDLDAGVNTANLVGYLYNGSIWNYGTPGTRTSTSTQSTNFVDFTTSGIVQLAELGSTPAPGNPTVYGNGVWNVYTYNAATATNYNGYFTDATLSLITTNSFTINQSPQYAPTYLGCGVTPNLYFTSAKRTGFAAGYYQIGIVTAETGTLIIDGITIASGTNLNNANVWTGQLTPTSLVEYQWNGNALPNSSSLTVTPITPAALVPGDVAGSQTICSGQTPQSSFTSTTPASSGCTIINPATAYQWQFSNDLTTWVDIVGANAATYNVGAAVNATTYYRRAISDACARIAYSDTLSVTVDNNVYGDPTVFGSNVWNAYCYTGQYASYKGYYVDNGLSFATSSKYPTSVPNSPSMAPGYLGCQIPNTNSTPNFSAIYKRQGFPTATYQIDIATIDDGGTLIINGITVGTWGCCAARPAVWTGPLDASSTVEWRWFGNAGQNGSSVNFTVVTPAPLLPGTISSDQSLCAGDIPVAFTNAGFPTGGCTVDYYQWEYSTDGGTTWIPATNSNSLAYTYTNSIFSNTQFRRWTYDICGSASVTPAITMSLNSVVPGDPTKSSTNAWAAYMYDDAVFGNYVGYDSLTVVGTVGGVNKMSFDTRNYYTQTSQPSSLGGAASYNGCQQVNTYNSVAFKRTGFDGNYYQIDIPCHDDDVYLFIDGVQKFFVGYLGGCGAAGVYQTNVWTGQLNYNSTVEFRYVNYPGPGYLQTKFIDLGSTPPSALVAGTISSTPNSFCATDLPYINSLTAATGGCAPNYQWQSSSDNITFTDIAGATSASYNAVAPLTATTYFRRKATDNCGNAPVFTTSTQLTLNSTIPGTPGVAGNGVWNAYVYNSANIANLTNYAGFYTDATLNFSTTTTFGNTGAPSTALGYAGCQVGNTNYTVQFVRTNIVATPTIYTIDVTTHDDNMSLYIDNVQVFVHNGCCDAHANVWTGTITPTTVVEFRYYNGASAGNLVVVMTPTSPSTSVTAGTIAGDQAVCYNGLPAAFTESVASTSGCYLYYQWQKSTDNITFNDIVGATSTVYTEVTPLTATTYYRRKTIGACVTNTALSNVITMTVSPALVVGSIAGTQTICSGTTASLTSASLPTGGTGSYTYQWQSSTNNITFNDIAGATTASYTTGTLSANTWYQRKDISCGSTLTTNTVAVSISPATSITTQPLNSSTCSGSNTTFTVVAVGNGLTYQWQLSTNGGVSFGNLTNAGIYSNVTTSTLNITGVLAGMANYQYRCIVTASAGCSPLSVTSTAGILTIGGPTITTQPSSVSICNNSSTTFTAVGSGTVTYQWQYFNGSVYVNLSNGLLNGITYSGVTTNVLALANATTTNSGTLYKCNVTSSCGSTLTNAATLTVNSVIANNTVTPVLSTVCSGTGTTINGSTPTGSAGGYTYQWQLSTDNITFNDIAGATLINRATGNLTVASYFRRVVSSGGCTSTSASTAISITPLVAITTQPVASSVCPGTATSFSVTATGSIVSYQWQEFISSWINISNTGVYSGANTNTLNISNASLGMNGYQYRAVITGTCAPITTNSSARTLTTNNTPTFTLNPPATVSTCAGVNYTFTTLTTTGIGVTYKWQVNNGSGYVDILSNYGGLYSNFAAANLRINTPTTAINGYKYRCVATGTCSPSATSSETVVTVYSALSPNSVSPAQSICAGDTPAQLNGSTPTGGGGNPISYIWQSSTDNVTYVPASGSINAQNYQPTSLVQNYYFRRQANAGNCAANNSAAILITVGAPTVITSQPADFGICANANTTLSMAATGTSLTYQWQVSTNGGSTWANATGGVYTTSTTNTLTLTNVPVGYNGYKYRCIVTGNCNPPTVTSDVATLSVNSAPSVSVQTVNRSICEGAGTTFPITFTAAGAMTYQWSVGGVSISDNAIYSGSTSNTLTLTGTPKTYNGNQYKCTASYLGCTTQSTLNGNLTVNAQAVVTVQPTTPAAVCTGTNVINIASLVAAPAGVTYQWQEDNGSGWSNITNGGVYSNVNTSSLRLTNLTSSYSGYQYRCKVTNACNITGDVSAGVAVTVNPGGQWLGGTFGFLTDWNTAGNWCGGVPTASTDVTISSSSTYQPVITATANCNSLTIGNGASVTISGANILNVNGDFTNNGTFTSNTSTVNFVGSNAQEISGASSTTFYKMKVNKTSTSAVTVSSNVKLTELLSFGTSISNNLVINNAGGGDFTFLSTVASSAHLDIISAPLPTISGNFTCQRYFPSQNGRYNFMLGVPVTNASVSELLPTAFDGSGNPTNGIYITGAFTGASTGNGLSVAASMYDYDEATGLYTSYPLTGGNITNAVTFGNGYRMSVRDGGTAPTVVAKTLSVKGALVNPGSYTYTNLVNVAGTKPFASGSLAGIGAPVTGGWNLISNPYMSDISIDMSNGSFWTKTNISNTTYIFNNSNKDFSSCASGVPAGNCVVPAFQAFFVQATGTPSLKINEQAKVSTTNSAQIKRVAQSSPLNYLGIKLSSSKTATFGYTYIRYVNGAAYGHDDFDGLKLGATNRGYITDLGVFSRGVDNVFYDVNAKPNDFVTDTTNLNVKLPVGNGTLDFTDVSNLESGYSIALYDKFTKTLTDVNTNPVYSFTTTSDSNSTGPRFQVIFNRTSAITGVNDNVLGSSSAVVVYPSPTVASNFNIAAIGLSDVADMFIYDLTGRIVYTSKLKVVNGKVGQQFDFTGILPAGMYTTVVKSGGNSYKQKVIIK